jgi:hypothetical protein
MTAKSLRDELAALGVKVPSTGNKFPIDLITVRDDLVRRATADLDDERPPWSRVRSRDPPRTSLLRPVVPRPVRPNSAPRPNLSQVTGPTG